MFWFTGKINVFYFSESQQCNSDFSGGGTYLNNQDQIINIGVIDHASGKDTRRFGVPGGCVAPEKVEIRDSQIAENALKLSILPSTFLAPGGGCIRTLCTPLTILQACNCMCMCMKGFIASSVTQMQILVKD